MLARFWAGVLGWEMTEDGSGGIALLPSDDTGFRLGFRPTHEPKAGPNQLHLDLTSSSLDGPAADGRPRARARRAGTIDVGQRPEEGHVVLADPEGNEFCVVEPGNNFLADCGFIGALSGDGSQEVGYFWSAALGWPLVWDQDQETAIRSPHGGPKITWGGPPLKPKTGTKRAALSTLRRPPAATSRPRSSGSSRSARAGSTSATARSTGWCWPTPTVTSSACSPPARAGRAG